MRLRVHSHFNMNELTNYCSVPLPCGDTVCCVDSRDWLHQRLGSPHPNGKGKGGPKKSGGIAKHFSTLLLAYCCTVSCIVTNLAFHLLLGGICIEPIPFTEVRHDKYPATPVVRKWQIIDNTKPIPIRFLVFVFLRRNNRFFKGLGSRFLSFHKCGEITSISPVRRATRDNLATVDEEEGETLRRRVPGALPWAPIFFVCLVARYPLGSSSSMSLVASNFGSWSTPHRSSRQHPPMLLKARCRPGDGNGLSSWEETHPAGEITIRGESRSGWGKGHCSSGTTVHCGTIT